MDCDFWYVREDRLILSIDQIITPPNAIVSYNVMEGSPSCVERTYTFDGLADLIAGAVFRENVDAVRLFRANNPIGNEASKLPYLSATKNLVRVFGAISIGDELLALQRKIGRSINERKRT